MQFNDFCFTHLLPYPPVCIRTEDLRYEKVGRPMSPLYANCVEQVQCLWYLWINWTLHIRWHVSLPTRSHYSPWSVQQAIFLLSLNRTSIFQKRTQIPISSESVISWKRNRFCSFTEKECCCKIISNYMYFLPLNSKPKDCRLIGFGPSIMI